MSEKILIVGGVAGGASTAARLRRLDENAEIILFERGEYISYANCGLPYHVGDVIRSRDALLLKTPQGMKDWFNFEVRVQHEVTKINRAEKTITVLNRVSGESYDESYDKLVLSTGSSPLKPRIPGIEHERIFSLWTVPDTDKIRAAIEKYNVRSAAVIGGGFIGLEMVENLHHRGIDVTLIEALDQVFAPFDWEMAQALHAELEHNDVALALGDAVESFEDAEDGVTVKLKSGTTLTVDFVILAIGVRPNSELAREAGLLLNERGGIVVNGQMLTDDPSIYAVGDVIQVTDFIDGKPAMIPLAGPANKQGRMVADILGGYEREYPGTLGTSIVKLFNLTAAATGHNEKTLQRNGLKPDVDYKVITIRQNNHAGYYPGATPVYLKMLMTLDGKKIFGAQVFGEDGVDKRIDVLSTAIQLNASAIDLKKLELAYAPPFSSAKDPVNMLGFAAENVVNDLVDFARWDVVETCDPARTQIIDVREDSERAAVQIPGAIGIPLGQLRTRLNEVPRDKETIVFCAVGVRANIATRILRNNGYQDVKIYPGGERFYTLTHYQKAAFTPKLRHDKVSDSGMPVAPVIDEKKADVSIRIDCSGLQCPGPILKVFETVKEMAPGQVMEVTASDPGFRNDVVAWCRRTGNTLVRSEMRGKDFVAVIRKESPDAAKPGAPNAANLPAAAPQGKTIIVFSGDFDRVIASFIIANGAAAMGRPVTMFFTFWGLNVLRKPENVDVQKNPIEKMFGMMMPRGAGKLSLSKMNMGGLGTSMMKTVMDGKNVDSLEQLIAKARENGVKFIACTMSMDIMGIKPEELIDGVELGGVGMYLGDAEESNVNLFI